MKELYIETMSVALSLLVTVSVVVSFPDDAVETDKALANPTLLQASANKTNAKILLKSNNDIGHLFNLFELDKRVPICANTGDNVS